jgi:hypothetical protein
VRAIRPTHALKDRYGFLVVGLGFCVFVVLLVPPVEIEPTEIGVFLVCVPGGAGNAI